MMEGRKAMRKTVLLLLHLFAICSFIFSGVIPAVASPQPKTLKEAVDYYYSGQNEGPVLVDTRVCKVIHSLDCKTVLNPNAVPMGETVNVWMQFFVPKDGVYDDIMVEYAHEGVPRTLTPHKIQGSIRYRVIDKQKLDKPGKWTISVKKGTTSLKKIDVQVIKK
jgi:hypothetical protein